MVSNMASAAVSFACKLKFSFRCFGYKARFGVSRVSQRTVQGQLCIEFQFKDEVNDGSRMASISQALTLWVSWDELVWRLISGREKIEDIHHLNWLNESSLRSTSESWKIESFDLHSDFASLPKDILPVLRIGLRFENPISKRFFRWSQTQFLYKRTEI